MAKADPISSTATLPRSRSAKLPARKKAAVAKPAKSGASIGPAPGKRTGRAAKPVAMQQSPTRAGASGKLTMGKAATKQAPRSVTRLTGSRKQAVRTRGGTGKLAPGKPVRGKTGAGKVGAGKKSASAAATARTITLKKAPTRRIPAQKTPPAPTARRSHSAASPKRAQQPTAPVSVRPAQSFTVSHLDEAAFKADGLRSYAHYRDLGIAAATAGLCQAHVIRFIPPCTEEVRKRHRHAADLQLVYVLKGWMKNEFEGIGEQMMSTGSCWLQPSGIEHTVLDYSADCEVLEIIVPANFKTEGLG
jgi:hypothetical protein